MFQNKTMGVLENEFIYYTYSTERNDGLVSPFYGDNYVRGLLIMNNNPEFYSDITNKGMLNLKRINSQLMVLFIVFALILSACSGNNQSSQGSNNNSSKNNSNQSEQSKDNADEKMIIKVGHILATDTSMHKGAIRFKEEVEKNSNGKMEVQVFPASQLGNEKDLVEQTQLGTIQMTIPSSAMLSNFAPKAGVLALPYVLKGDNEREHYESLIKLSKSDAYNEIAMEAEQEDLKVISESIWWYGDKHITTNDRPIRTPEDLKGIKIRVPDAKVHTEPFKLMGANVTPMAFTDVYMALKTGTVEAQENPIATIISAKFYEVSNTLSSTRHMVINQIPTFSKKWWETLDAEQQKIITDAMIKAGEHSSAEQLKANEEGLEVLREKGMEITENIDLDAFRDATKDVYKQFEDKNGVGYYESIIKAQE